VSHFVSLKPRPKRGFSFQAPSAGVWRGAPGQILSSYAAYYNQVRTHLVLGKDAPLGRAVQRSGVIVAIPILSGLHHHYVRM
jgi:hypothetical protein